MSDIERDWQITSRILLSIAAISFGVWQHSLPAAIFIGATFLLVATMTAASIHFAKKG